MKTKTYVVQTWDEAGALQNNYEVSIDQDEQLRDLKKFLKLKSAHFVVTLKPEKPAQRKRSAR